MHQQAGGHRVTDEHAPEGDDVLRLEPGLGSEYPLGNGQRDDDKDDCKDSQEQPEGAAPPRFVHKVGVDGSGDNHSQEDECRQPGVLGAEDEIKYEAQQDELGERAHAAEHDAPLNAQL